MPIARWNSRPPRFVYDAEGRRLMRYAPMRAQGSAFVVEALDISTTGLSFALAPSLAHQATGAPEEGDTIKIEFAPPGRDAIACFATVVRVDEVGEWDLERGDVKRTKVAVKFRNLPSAHERALKLALDPLVGAKEKDESLSGASMPLRDYVILAGALVVLAMALGALAAPYSWWFLGGARAGTSLERTLGLESP